MIKTTNLMNCDLPNCTSSAEPNTKGWMEAVFYPNGNARRLHICPSCATTKTIGEANEASFPPKPAAKPAADKKSE